MIDYVDRWFCSADRTALVAFCQSYVNCLGPEAGRAAVAESVDEDGNRVQAQDAVGDPALYYVGIRDVAAAVATDGVSVVAEEVASAVLGVWA